MRLSWWQTYGPALIAAGAALLVVLIDRLVAARREREHRRRETRASHYADFLSASNELIALLGDVGGRAAIPAEARVTMHRVSDSRAVIHLTAPDEVVLAADAFGDAITAWAREAKRGSNPPEPVTQARKTFTAAARTDVNRVR